MNEHLKKYKYKEIWGRREDDFFIEVVRWNSEDILEGEISIWNIYCYIYPSHKLFNELTDESIFGAEILNFPGRCAYCRFHRNTNGEIASKQYGNDYNPIWDEEIRKINNPEEAYEVFNDAEDLYNFLKGNN